MTRWAQGVDKIQELLRLGDLQKVQGAEVDGQPLLDKAVRTLTSARAAGLIIDAAINILPHLTFF